MKVRTKRFLITIVIVAAVIFVGGAAVDYWMDWSPGVVALPAAAVAVIYLRSAQVKDRSPRI